MYVEKVASLRVRGLKLVYQFDYAGFVQSHPYGCID